MTYSLGGYDYIYQQGFTGAPQFQITALQTPFWAVQEGIAIGMYTHPIAPAPLVSAQVHPSKSYVQLMTPKNFGRRQNWGHPTRWRYYFESAFPLNATPPDTI